MAKMYIGLPDLERIVEFVKQMGVNTVTIESDTSSGIGSTITATIRTKIDEYDGEFTIDITDYGQW